MGWFSKKEEVEGQEEVPKLPELPEQSDLVLPSKADFPEERDSRVVRLKPARHVERGWRSRPAEARISRLSVFPQMPKRDGTGPRREGGTRAGDHACRRGENGQPCASTRAKTPSASDSC